MKAGFSANRSHDLANVARRVKQGVNNESQGIGKKDLQQVQGGSQKRDYQSDLRK